MGDRKRKLLLTLLIVGVLGSIAGYGTFSAFTATTSNENNQFASGTVKIDDDSGATTALFPNLTNLGPGSTTAKCLRIKYNGSITAASVKLFISSGAPATPPGDKYTLQVERGSGLTTVDGTRVCTGFTASSTGFATADIGTFPTTSGAGVDGKASAATWAQNDTIDYRFTLVVKDDATENAHTTTNAVGPFTFTWKASS